MQTNTTSCLKNTSKQSNAGPEMVCLKSKHKRPTTLAICNACMRNCDLAGKRRNHKINPLKTSP